MAQTKTRVRIAKSGGDDAYLWALFIDGRECCNGISRNEAEWRKREANRAHAEGKVYGRAT